MENKNVLNFSDALEKAEEQEQEQGNVCEHCAVKKFAIDQFFKNIDKRVKLSKAQISFIEEEIDSLFEFTWDRSKVATLRPYIGTMIEEIEYVDGED